MTPDDLKRWQDRHRYTGKRLAEELGVHPMTVTYWRSGKVAIPRTVELALKWLEGEKRMDQIGQNGNEGEHYWQINSGVTPHLPCGTRVMVEYRNGERETDEVQVYDWSLGANDYDIIRWRLA